MSDPASGPGRTILITGAAGRIGTVLRPGLAELGWTLRSFDRDPIPDPLPGEQIVSDLEAGCAGADAVVHLAATPTERSFEHILHANIESTFATFEAARQAGVPRVVFASSIHASGFSPPVPLLRVDEPPRPDTYYGVSKLFGENLARLYADRYGMRFACLRIGAFQPRPRGSHGRAHWLSHGDAVRLVHACLSAPELTFAVVYGRSNNAHGWTDLSSGRALGYEPVDDAETFDWDEEYTEGALGASMTGPEYDAERVQP